jgi:uncharacterized protein YkwD
VPNHIPVRRRAALVAAVAVSVVPAIAPSHASAARPDRFEAALIEQINGARAAHGLRAVRHSGRLSRVADRHSRELTRTGRLSHVALDGSTASQRLSRFTRGPIGEVIAWNSRRRPRAVAIVSQWLGSPGHRAVLLDGRFGRVGLGARRGRRGMTVTADFARG